MRTIRKNRVLILVVFAATASFIATARAGAEELLRWKFKVGEKLNYNMVQKMWMSASTAGGKKAAEPQITWNQYMKDCGPNAQKANAAESTKAFDEKYKGKSIEWTGRVKSAAAKPMGKGFDIVLNMDPTEPDAAWTHITLTAGEPLNTQASALKPDSIVKFAGKLLKQAGASANHEVEATELSALQTMNTMMEQNLEMTWDVQGVDEATGEAVIRQKFDRVKMKMTTPVGGFEYDSKSEAAPTGLGAMIAPMYKAMTEGDFEITMTSRGEVKDVKIPQQVIDALKNSPGDNMGDIATADGFKKMISQGALVLPKDPPKEGESWQNKVVMNNQAIGKQSVETTYRYEGTKDIKGTKYALIRPELKMDFENNAQPQPGAAEPQQPPQLRQLQMKIKDQSSDGEVLFNINEGRLYSTTLKQNVVIEASAGGQSVDQRIDQRIDVEVTPAGEKKSAEAEKPAASGAKEAAKEK